MRIALVILIGIHGIIHLFGFLKAYGIFEFSGISQQVSKVSGVFWLLTFLLFSVALVLVLTRSEYWWITGIVAVVASQVLIFGYWSDTKFGTIANLIILLATIVGYSEYKFRTVIKKERIELFKQAENRHNKIVQADDISTLPPIVQKWLRSSGVVGKPLVSNVHLTQALQLKLEPGQDKWNQGTAEQYFTIDPPAFNWTMNGQMNPIINVVGRDKYVKGHGDMLIKIFSLIPVVDVKNDDKINQATLQRYLSEIVWFPSAALSNYIQWENLDENSARATMVYNGTKGSGVFYFDKNGQFKKFVAMRFKEVTEDKPKEWVITVSKTEALNGIMIPTECEVSWILNDEQWTWLMLEVKHIEYNLNKMPDATSS